VFEAENDDEFMLACERMDAVAMYEPRDDGLAGKAKAEEAAFKARVEEIGYHAAYREVLINGLYFSVFDAIMETEALTHKDYFNAFIAAMNKAEELDAEMAEEHLEPLNAVRIGEIADLLDMDAAEVAAFCHADWGDPHHRAWLHTSTNRAIANWILACTR
jgi:hypothetical protein